MLALWIFSRGKEGQNGFSQMNLTSLGAREGKADHALSRGLLNPGPMQRAEASLLFSLLSVRLLPTTLLLLPLRWEAPSASPHSVENLGVLHPRLS